MRQDSFLDGRTAISGSVISTTQITRQAPGLSVCTICGFHPCLCIPICDEGDDLIPRRSPRCRLARLATIRLRRRLAMIEGRVSFEDYLDFTMRVAFHMSLIDPTAASSSTCSLSDR